MFSSLKVLPLQMLISKVTKQAAPLFLLAYFLFSQVYPYLHIHVNAEENKQHVEISFHPVETCVHEHKGINNHSHECSHLHGDWEHTVQKREINKPFYSEQLIIGKRIQFSPPRELYYFEKPIVFNSIHHPNFLSLRAPPASC